MLKLSWSCLGALLIALLFQTSESVSVCQCKDSKTQEECHRACILANEPKHNIEQRDIYSGSISSDGGNVDQKRRELMLGDLLDLLPPGVWREDKEVQEDGLPLIRKARQLDTKRSYAMEHFRWGKPVGRKRRPVKVFPNGVEEESAESYPVDFRRSIPNNEHPEIPELADDEVGDTMGPNPDTEGGYVMQHFRWGPPPPKPKPKNKRYGGFMVSEKSHTPLMTLFKNAIIKNAHEKGE
ncbi:pro-opiomelanocortin [Petaurus breviceps papuanus]|uniref:pro-opiomelanocortin n=1 Tax=Petaurus breviceps papuanus TaxID=3040969 RepID=UPI0036D93F28